MVVCTRWRFDLWLVSGVQAVEEDEDEDENKKGGTTALVYLVDPRGSWAGGTTCFSKVAELENPI